MGTKRWYIILFVVIVLAVAAALHPTQYRSGWMLLRSGRIGEAMKRFVTVAHENPRDYRSMRLLASALEEQGRVDEAGEYYERVVALKPNDLNYRDLIRFYTWTQQPREALRAMEQWYAYRRQGKMSFRDEEGRRLLEALYAAEVLFQNYRKAIEVLSTYQQEIPSEAAAVESDIVELYEKDGDMSTAATYFEGVLAQDPENAFVLEKFAEIAPLCGKGAIARALLLGSWEKHPQDERLWNRLLDFEARAGDLTAVRKLYLERIEAHPGNDQLRRGYVEWLIGTDQQKAAIAYIEGMARIVPDPSYHETLIQLYEWNNAKDKLLPIYRDRFQRNPDDRGNARKLISILTDARQYGEAEQVLRKLTSRFPRDREYDQMLIDLYDAQGKPGAAINALERAVRVSDDPRLLKQLGERYLWSAGEDEKAIASPADKEKKRPRP